MKKMKVYLFIGLFLCIFFITITMIKTDAKFEPVELTINYETLCPDSEQFVTTQLSKALSVFDNNLILKLIPYGKANVKLIIFHV